MIALNGIVAISKVGQKHYRKPGIAISSQKMILKILATSAIVASLFFRIGVSVLLSILLSKIGFHIFEYQSGTFNSRFLERDTQHV